MAYITEQFVGDRSVQLGCEDFVRPMPWGTNWTKIRIGIRLATNGYATIGGWSGCAPFPRIGVCTGSQATWAGTSTDCMVWTALTWNGTGNYSGSAPNNYYFFTGGSTNVAMFQKVGSAFNYLASYWSASVCWSANPTALRSCWFLDIYKPSNAFNNITATVYLPNSTQVLVDCTRSNYLAMLENETAPANLTGTGGANYGTMSRTNKDWDSVFVAGMRAVPTTEFFDISLVRFY